MLKVLLIVTFTQSGPGYSFDVLRYEVASKVDCQIQGAELAKDTLSKIPGIASVHYVCVEKGYGE